MRQITVPASCWELHCVGHLLRSAGSAVSSWGQTLPSSMLFLHSLPERMLCIALHSWECEDVQLGRSACRRPAPAATTGYMRKEHSSCMSSEVPPSLRWA